jgi:hypothetical protein
MWNWQRRRKEHELLWMLFVARKVLFRLLIHLDLSLTRSRCDLRIHITINKTNTNTCFDLALAYMWDCKLISINFQIRQIKIKFLFPFIDSYAVDASIVRISPILINKECYSLNCHMCITRCSIASRLHCTATALL